MPNRYGIIYMIQNTINKKIYFGQTAQTNGFNDRYRNGEWWIHTDNDHLKRSAEKYGHENFIVVKEFDVAYSQQELDKLEDLYICMYDTINYKKGYNKRRGGNNGKMSEESKKKNSDSQKKLYENGYVNPMTSKNHSDSAKQKMSDSRKGTKMPAKTKKALTQANTGSQKTNETKKKISESNKGKRRSQQTKENISNACKGRPAHNRKKVLCVETDIIYLSATHCSKEMNLDNSSISKCCKGKVKQVGGYHFIYVEEGDL